jgi:hypothetical protein
MKMEDKDRTPTRLAVLDLEGNLLGYKADTFWSLSTNSEEYKPHPFEVTKPERHLARNLLSIFNGDTIFGKIVLEGDQFKNCSEGLIVSVQDVSEQNFGKELLRYRILKEGDKYVVRE